MFGSDICGLCIGGYMPLMIKILAVFVVLGALGVALALALWLHQGGMLQLAAFNTWVADTFIQRLGLLGVFGLMVIESSLLPFPSEIVIPPAADLVRRQGEWSATAVIFSGVLGSLVGAWFNYGLARWLGRPVVLGLIARYGRMIHLSHAHFERVEALFLRYGSVTTLVGRLIPGVRQLISLPAGIARMPFGVFSLFTSLGSAIWVGVLFALGWNLGAHSEAFDASLKGVSAVIVGCLTGLGLAWWFWRKIKTFTSV